MDRAQVLKDLVILFLTMMVCAVPFMSQAFHMDDNFYMDMARNARAKPWYPNDLPYVFEGRPLPDMGSHSHPPLQTYFLALLQRFAGEGPGREWIYHSFALVFPILALVGMYFVAARLVQRPVWPTLMLAVTPLFMVMQHNLMTDIPMLAFWLACIASYLWAMDLDCPGLYAAASLFLFAALFTSFQSAALVPLVAYLQLRKGKGLRGWFALSLPVLAMTGWFALNYLHYHRFLLRDTAGFIQSRDPFTALALGTKLAALLQYQGWLVMFPLFPLLLFGRGLRGRLLAVVTLATVYLAQGIVPHYRPLEKLIFVAGLSTGVLISGKMALFLRDSFRAKNGDSYPISRKPAPIGVELQGNRVTVPVFYREEAQFLALWYFAVAIYCILLFTEGSARYILPLMPPLLIAFFRELELQEVAEYRLARAPLFNSSMIVSGALVLSLAWGLALSHADREFAGIYPRAAAEVSKIIADLPAYHAGEWGFRYYFRLAGMRQLPTDENNVQGGSLVVRPALALPYELPAGLNSMLMPFKTFSYDVKTPLRMLDRESHAGFYSTGWGLLPFSFSRKSLERLEVSQVNYLVEKLPWAKIESATAVNPWPGYVTIDARGPLAILARPGTRILYDWSFPAPLELTMQVGVSNDSYAAGDQRVFSFEVVQYDGAGSVLWREAKSLAPGMRASDRKWQSVQIRLRSRDEGLRVLELRYESQSGSTAGAGAFAEASLRKLP